MRIKHLAAIAMIAALGSAGVFGEAEAQGLVDPMAAQPSVEESTLPADDFSSLSSNWRFWALSFMWTPVVQSPTPITFRGAALPAEWWDRSLRTR